MVFLNVLHIEDAVQFFFNELIKNGIRVTFQKEEGQEENDNVKVIMHVISDLVFYVCFYRLACNTSLLVPAIPINVLLVEPAMNDQILYFLDERVGSLSDC
jgi:hypothetical protein